MSSEYIYIYLSHVITRLLILLSSRAICFLAGIIIVNVAVPLTNICPFVTRNEYSSSQRDNRGLRGQCNK